MMMKKHLIYIRGIVATFFVACENVSEEDRFLDVAEIEARRTVLLEDYTGQACVNCPNAHREAALLHSCSAYHDNLIIVAVHAGMQAVPSPAGLKQPEGDEYADKFGVKEYPNGMVNRRGGLKSYALWGAAIYEEIQRSSPLEMSLNAYFTNKKISVTGELLASEALQGKLQLWLVEDSIKTFQSFVDKSEPKYVHNHVFLDAINGTWGEDVILGSDERKGFEYKDFALTATWNRKPENLSVVAFVYDENGVIQAAQCKVNVNE